MTDLETRRHLVAEEMIRKLTEIDAAQEVMARLKPALKAEGRDKVTLEDCIRYLCSLKRKQQACYTALDIHLASYDKLLNAMEDLDKGYTYFSAGQDLARRLHEEAREELSATIHDLKTLAPLCSHDIQFGRCAICEEDEDL